MLLDPLLYGSREVGYLGLLLQIARGQVAQFLELLNHRRDDEPHHACEDCDDEDERDDDGQGTPGNVELVLHELDDRVQQVGKEPCHEEGQQHTAQVVEQVEHTQGNECSDEPAYEGVEGDGFHLGLRFEI